MSNASRHFCRRLQAIALPLIAAAVFLGGAAVSAAPAVRDADHFFLQPKDVVVWLGDSITAEYRYPTFALWDISRLYPELASGEGKVTFINTGISGDTAGGGLNRVGDLLAKHKPTVVVVCFGMNHRGGKDANYAATSQKIVKKIKEAGAIPVLLTSPPVCTVKNKGLQWQVDLLKGYADDLKKIADEEKLVYADCFTPLVKYQKTTRKDFTWGDTVHPNAEGHYVMTTAMLQAWGYGKPLVGGKLPEKIAFFDGDAYVGGKGWAKPAAGSGKADAAVTDKEAHAGKACLEWSCDAAKGVVGAWNLYSWSPNNAGLNVAAFKNFSMWVKVAGQPKPDALKVYLDCSFTKTLPLNYKVRQTPRLDVSKYCKDVLEGNWHEIVIPTKDFMPAECEWDPQTFSELGIEAPCADAGKISVFVDDVCFKDRLPEGANPPAR
jgi:lysophospholipase L1-like esterase